MTLVTPSQSSAGEEIKASSINGPVNQLASVINGNIDDTNVASLSGTKIAAGTINTAAIAGGAVTAAKIDFTTFPRFSVYRNAAHNSSSSGLIVGHDTKVYDSHTAFSIATSKFTAPFDGLYLFAAVAGNSAATSTAMYCQLRKNGTPIKTGNLVNPSAAPNYLIIYGQLPLVAGDTVDHFYVGGAGSAMTTGQSNCWFEGTMIAR